jgi:sterol desaturase/sphingolipid hydroxylase (fatty acid hydroxylase superfamily)
MLIQLALTFVGGLILTAAIVIVGLGFELSWPARRQGLQQTAVNGLYAASAMFMHTAFAPAVTGLTTWAVSASFGGLIVLPSHGPGLVGGALVYFVVMDLGEYVFHRAQHRVPCLWALHSLHHSDTQFNVTTAVRHHWIEYFIKSCTIFLVIGVLFKTSPAIIGAYGIFSYYNIFVHANLNLGFGRFSFVLNSPRYHRLHHSSLPEHFNINFSGLFPIFDLIFGSYHRPRTDECPPTGLDSQSAAPSLGALFLWPLAFRPASDRGNAGAAGQVGV